MNAALRVADELSGCDSNRRSGYVLWSSALRALNGRGRALDSENLERLFWRDNRHVRHSHLCQLPQPISCCICAPVGLIQCQTAICALEA